MEARRLDVLRSHIMPVGERVTQIPTDSSQIVQYRQALLACREEVRRFIDKENCHPIMIRLAWHDSGTFDKSMPYPDCGGANGSIRFPTELKHGANAGLIKAVNFLRPFKDKYSILSWADIIQMASAQAVELAGGPHIPMRYGRLDTASEAECPREGNLPAAEPPFPDGSRSAAEHLRKVFHRMGFDDREIVVLSGAHTLGRAFKERSGVVQEGIGADKATQFTKPPHRPRADGQSGLGMPGGRSWTENWLTFDNSYYQQKKGHGLLTLSTDSALSTDPEFKVHYLRYANDQQAWFADYAYTHKKLSELGSRFSPPEGIYL
eukprot:Sspe_Gene.71993::Locus_42812_Transcript_1_1_Confidence_1.000_Length_1933::g.71993::m.71993/K00434/E1.11.1.11; L-ascorbate peroxidase